MAARHSALPGLLAATLLVAATTSPLLAQERPKPGTITRPAPTRPPARGGQPTPSAPRTPAPPATPDSLRPMALYGVVWDSVASAPLARATIQVALEADPTKTFSTESDSAGRWRIGGILPGRYLAGFFHPALDGLGLEAPVVRLFVRPDTAAEVELGIPGPERIRASLCGPNGDGRGAMSGLVRDADTGEPVRGAKVVVTWNEFGVTDTGIRNARRRVPVKVRDNGFFAVCGLPPETDLVASAEAPRRIGGLIEIRVRPNALVRRDFALGDSTSALQVQVPDTMAAKEGRPAYPTTIARGSAQLAGTVRGRDGRPLQGARLMVWGSGVTGETNANGTFTLGGLPAGTYALEVRAIGHAPKRVTVDLSSRRPATVAVRLEDAVNTLAGVVVQGQRSATSTDLTGFAERSKRGMGRYINAEDIEKRSPFVLTDVLRTTPGLQVVPNGSFGYAVVGRGQCTPTVYVDGMRVMDGASDLDQLVRPTDVAGIEVYNGGATVPAQFSGLGDGGCGTIVVWTKRGGRAPASGSR